MPKKTPTPTDTLIDQLVDEIFRLRGRVLSASREVNEERGLSHAQGVVLSAVVRAVEAPTVARMARSLGLTRQSVQRTANDMESMGLLRFEDNPHHKVAKQLVATAAGLAAHARSSGNKGSWTDGVHAVASESELAEVVAVLRRIRKHLEHPDAAGGGTG